MGKLNGPGQNFSRFRGWGQGWIIILLDLEGWVRILPGSTDQIRILAGLTDQVIILVGLKY